MERKPNDMGFKEIRKALIDADVTQTELANECDVTFTMVHNVLKGTSVSDRIRRHIAKRIGIDVRRIWPSTYLSKDNRRDRSMSMRP